jgi:hypothetical protein
VSVRALLRAFKFPRTISHFFDRLFPVQTTQRAWPPPYSLDLQQLSGCATQPYPDAIDPPGFLFGLLHGFLIFFTLIGSFFTDYRIYAFPNSGVWYDVGYVIGAAAFLGGGGSAAS